ncbi:amyloid fiber anchoring/assembly protein TapA [Mesobacillus subterraneus]|uniref:amyloid fiber anchoring/assembly protein TapA n=1 Tax=Mesobacillus subterraneus TaxID=285983 RepID=UPI00147576F1|nr:amyloid fiber anchoring/assembly protein TapA [Mesobacillus subterraneus]
MGPIRYGRLGKFRKKKGYHFLLIKFLAVCYLLIGISSTLTGQTDAYFSDSNSVSGTIKAGIWETQEKNSCSSNKKHGDWDCSSLEFRSSEFDGQNIIATIQNTGSDMKASGKYEVFYSENGNPKDGQKLSETFSFKALKKGEEVKLTFTPELSGNYKFKVYQHKDHPGGGELWSDEIIVIMNKVSQPANDEKEEESRDQKAQEKPNVEEDTSSNDGVQNTDKDTSSVEKIEEQPEQEQKEEEDGGTQEDKKEEEDVKKSDQAAKQEEVITENIDSTGSNEQGSKEGK